MANTKNSVTVELPRARGSEAREVFVGVNGVNYLIPRGKAVEVPAFVAEELSRAAAAERFVDSDKDRRRAQDL